MTYGRGRHFVFYGLVLIGYIISKIFFSHILKVLIDKTNIFHKPLFSRILILLAYILLIGLILRSLNYLANLVIFGEPFPLKLYPYSSKFSTTHFFLTLYGDVLFFSIWTIIYMVVFYFQKYQKSEIEKISHEKKLLEYELLALRAQMNPHFIFNSLNSIKSLMQQNQVEKAGTYLTIFSKHLRTLLNNTEKKEITLFDEIETCKLYLQLEAMRLEGRFSYEINIDETVDMKSIKISALIIQPFIENAIWHGIIPKGSKGNIELCIAEKGNDIVVIIEDDGIGLENSKNNKTGLDISHESKGLSLTEERLKLDNFLRQRNARLDISEVKDNAGIPLGTRVVLTINKET